jgi:predicted ATPase
MEHFLTGFFCRKKDFWHIQSCRGENSNLAEFAQMRQKRLSKSRGNEFWLGLVRTHRKGTFVADSPDGGLVYPPQVG